MLKKICYILGNIRDTKTRSEVLVINYLTMANRKQINLIKVLKLSRNLFEICSMSPFTMAFDEVAEKLIFLPSIVKFLFTLAAKFAPTKG